ncbi:MAG TPA: preprotein translocase subunit YajC [Rectinemataceae bacterium]|nr:preprotein translocase subunit YajC [Rectinemataceae bacterium]
MDKLFSGLTLLQAAPAAGGSATGSMLSTLIPFALVFVIFYFLIIRPQNKKQKDMKKMIEAVQKGDKVVTIGGMHATVDKVKDGIVVLRVDENVKMEFSKSAIASVEGKKDEKADKAVEASADKSDKTDKPEKPFVEKN